MTPRPSALVPWPRPAAAVIGACVLLVGGLGALVAGDTHGTGFDDAVNRWIHANVGAGAMNDLLQLTSPGLVAGLLIMIAAGAALLRRWDVVVLAAATPLIALLLTEKVLKPLVGRTNSVDATNVGTTSYAYPSGHETAFGSLIAVVGLLLVRSGVRTSRKLAGVVVLVALLVLAAIALVGRFYHFATDTIGSMGLVVGCVLGCGLVIDAVFARIATRRDAQVTYGR